MHGDSGQPGAHSQRLASAAGSPRRAATFGLWLFIAIEIMCFGALFCLYVVFRAGAPEPSAFGGRSPDIGWGTINTGILLVSGVMMAMAVRSARFGHRSHTVLFLGLTLICAVDFLGVTYIEYRGAAHASSARDRDVTDPRSNGAGGAPLPVAVEPGVAAQGEVHYRTTCSACHGPAGEGLVNFGRPLTTSAFVAGLDDEALLDFLRTGRSVNDPLNTTGIAMLPRGGNPVITDQELAHVVAFVRTLQGDGVVGEGVVPREAGVVDSPPAARRSFSFGVLLTGVHAAHVFAGALVLAWSLLCTQCGRFSGRDFTFVRLGGMYWYFVGIVWLVIFPLLYLVD